jgi:hypothetical protein
MRLRANEQTYEVVGRPAGVTLSPDGDRSRYRDDEAWSSSVTIRDMADLAGATEATPRPTARPNRAPRKSPANPIGRRGTNSRWVQSTTI